MKCAACGSLAMQDPKSREKFAIWALPHHRTNLSGYIFTTKARIDNQKKNLLNSNVFPTCLHNMLNFGPLEAETSVISVMVFQ